MSYTNQRKGAWPISLCDPRLPLDPSLREAAGGFAWWYVDHVDAAGDGLVLIWSFGLPFLPGYLNASRRQTPERPGARPSLNLVLYEKGRPSFYLLQEYPEQSASWRPSEWRLADSHIKLREDLNGRTLDVHLDCPLPRSPGRLQGNLRVAGPTAHFSDAVAQGVQPEHQWSPVMGPAHLEAELCIDGVAHKRSGRAYHDRNAGTAPLDQLGIRAWTWGRWVGPSGTRIYYVLWPEDETESVTAWGVHIAPDGMATLHPSLEVSMSEARRARYGMKHSAEMQLKVGDKSWLQVQTDSVVDDGPFYLRTLVTSPQADGFGVGEWVAPQRIDKDWQRPFVRMRVHQTAGPNSFWLPLFTGPSQGRLRRLVGSGL